MNRKGSVNIVLLVVIVVIAVVAGYFLLNRPTVPLQSIQPSTNTPPPTEPPVQPTPPVSPTAPTSGIKGSARIQDCGGAVILNTIFVKEINAYCQDDASPLKSDILLIKSSASVIEKQITTDNSGSFQVELPPGVYTINAKHSAGGPYTVEVKSGMYAKLELKFWNFVP